MLNDGRCTGWLSREEKLRTCLGAAACFDAVCIEPQRSTCGLGDLLGSPLGKHASLSSFFPFVTATIFRTTAKPRYAIDANRSCDSGEFRGKCLHGALWRCTAYANKWTNDSNGRCSHSPKDEHLRRFTNQSRFLSRLGARSIPATSSPGGNQNCEQCYDHQLITMPYLTTCGWTRPLRNIMTYTFEYRL